MTNTKTIARNAGWYGLENGIGFVVTLFTSIAIARTLGPSKMGYIIYVMWIASIVSTLGGMGIPETRPINPYSKADWEGVGVEPDVRVKAADALETAEKLAESKLRKK